MLTFLTSLVFVMAQKAGIKYENFQFWILYSLPNGWNRLEFVSRIEPWLTTEDILELERELVDWNCK